MLFLEYIYKYTKVNSSTIILTLIYIDRICNMNKFKISYYNIQKLILAAMILAIKYNEDEINSFKFYAKIWCVTIKEICTLEFNFLSLINYNLYVTDELFHKYSDYILSSDSDEEEYDYSSYDDADNDKEYK